MEELELRVSSLGSALEKGKASGNSGIYNSWERGGEERASERASERLLS